MFHFHTYLVIDLEFPNFPVRKFQITNKVKPINLGILTFIMSHKICHT
jgi:hypothetical protein